MPPATAVIASALVPVVPFITSVWYGILFSLAIVLKSANISLSNIGAVPSIGPFDITPHLSAGPDGCDAKLTSTTTAQLGLILNEAVRLPKSPVSSWEHAPRRS